MLYELNKSKNNSSACYIPRPPHREPPPRRPWALISTGGGYGRPDPYANRTIRRSPKLALEDAPGNANWDHDDVWGFAADDGQNAVTVNLDRWDGMDGSAPDVPHAPAIPCYIRLDNRGRARAAAGPRVRTADRKVSHANS